MRSFLTKLFLLALAALSGTTPAFASGGTRAQVLGAMDDLNQSATSGPRVLLGTKVIRDSVRTIVLKYDFALQGGAIGTGSLYDIETGKVAKLPKGALIVDCIIDVITAGTTSASGTMALGTGASGVDLKAALAAASYTGRVACIPVGSAATAIKLAADVTPSYTIATGALTAGKWYVILQYIVSEST